ncbi:MAG: nitrous oxide reductase family maturation protein NosD [Candidatus Odinarchaeota archaeon]
MKKAVLVVLVVLIALNFQWQNRSALMITTALNDLSSSQVSFTTFTSQKMTSTQYTSHGIIYIDGNGDFLAQAASEKWTGDGSHSNPIIISDYSISTGLWLDNLIDVRNTDLFFRITNCNLMDGFRSIYLENVSNAEISSNSVSIPEYGIVVHSSHSVAITGNTIADCLLKGIFLYQSDNLVVAGNTITSVSNSFQDDDGNGIVMQQTDLSQITGNNISQCVRSGMYVNASAGNFIALNSVYDNSFGLLLEYGSEHNTIHGNSIGKHVSGDGIYLFSANNNTISDNDCFSNWGGIFIDESDFCRVSSNTIYNSTQGITLRFADNCTITGNSAINSSYGIFGYNSPSNNTISSSIVVNSSADGIYLGGGSFNTVFNNSISNSSENGIFFDNSQYNTISCNSVSDSGLYGISLNAADYNTVKRNVFTDNYPSGPSQAADETALTTNAFSYNYWSDWTGPDADGDLVVDNPYFIDGSAANKDHYPLVSPDLTQYEYHSPISINSNAEFLDQALIERWPGDGTADNPVIIDGLVIVNTSANLIDIRDTDLFFVISDCYLVGGWSGICLDKVSNGIIVNNHMVNISVVGIDCFNSTNNSIHGNEFYSNSWCSIFINESNFNNIASNTVHYSTWGIYLRFSSYCNATGNTVVKSEEGISLIGGAFNTVLNNSVSNSSYNGFRVEISQNNIITRNFIANNTLYGISLIDAGNNTVKRNAFADNNLVGSSQANDHAPTATNAFSYNYWSDWTEPDTNMDGIVDIHYLIDGSAGNYDPYPLVSPNYYHLLAMPIIIYPNGGEILSDTVTIQWLPAIDTSGHSITYAIYYSATVNYLWVLLASDLPGTGYLWDTTTVANGADFSIRVIASCSGGLVAEDISDQFFTVKNDDDGGKTTSTSSSSPLPITFTSPGFLTPLLVFSLPIVAFIRRRKRG